MCKFTVYESTMQVLCEPVCLYHLPPSLPPSLLHPHQVVTIVNDPEWINSVSYTPMLRYSILAPFLSEYFPDGVGISPTTVRHVPRMAGAEGASGEGEKEGETVKDEEEKLPNGPIVHPPLLADPLHPFNHPQEGPRARAFTPDVMEPEEIEAFPEYHRWVALPWTVLFVSEQYIFFQNAIILQSQIALLVSA